jgi:hypothetical protein
MAMSNRQVQFGNLLNQISDSVAETIWNSVVNKVNITEPTITNQILTTVQNNATFVQVATPNEADTGADWLWTIQSEGGNRSKVYCQAKILNPQNGNYPHLDHRVGGHGGQLQVDILLNTAQQNNAAAYYVLYNYTFYNGMLTEYNNPENGVFVVPANMMKNQIDNFVNDNRIGNTSLHWSSIKNIALPFRELIRFA